MITLDFNAYQKLWRSTLCNTCRRSRVLVCRGPEFGDTVLHCKDLELFSRLNYSKYTVSVFSGGLGWGGLFVATLLIKNNAWLKNI